MEAAGGEVIYEATSCFVWTSAGAAGLAEQEQVKKLADEFGNEQLVIVLGLNEPEDLRIFATTFEDGDPSYAGPLAGVALGLKSYHIFELKSEIPTDVWSTEMAMKELEVEDESIEQICQTMRGTRGERPLASHAQRRGSHNLIVRG